MRRLATLLLLGSLGCPGCLEKLAPGAVANGVARLSVRHAAIIGKAIEIDKTCGFSAPQVLRAAIVMGQSGEEGAVTTRVTDCELSFPESTPISTDCLGVVTSVKGKVKVSAVKRIRGTITGNADKPVIPFGADAVEVTVDSTFDNLDVTKSDSPASMVGVDGKLHFVVAPRVALSKSLGVCSIPTLDLSFWDMRYENANLILNNGERAPFPVYVPESDFSAQVGKWLEHENDFEGDLKVWESMQTVPTGNDRDGLDAVYSAKDYFDAVACTPDLATPVSYACPSQKDQIAHGAARLTISQLGAITSLVDADTRCGFSSPAVLAAAQLTGTPGGPGSAKLTLQAPCVISFPNPTVIGTDCTGVSQTAKGSISVTGTKTVAGVLTGDVAQPAAPNGRDPATLTLHVVVNDFSVTDSASPGRELKAKSGTLDATLKPRVAIDSKSDICSITTSAVEFSGVAWSNAVLELTNDGLTFQTSVSQSTLDAQSGTKGERTNYLAGTIIADGVPITIPPPGAAPVLDPTYDAAKFEQTFSCKPGYKAAPDDAACSLDKALATNTARLLLLAIGTTASQIQTDTNCGFSAFSVKTNPTLVTGNNGQQGTIQWDIQNCRIGQSSGVQMASTDCTAITTLIAGTANVSGRRIVKGERHSEFVIFDSIVPQTRDALSLDLMNTTLSEYSVYKVPAGTAEPYAKLVVHSGTLSGKVTPGLGERTSKPGVFDVGTPVATFTNVQLMNANATLTVAGKRFTLSIPNAQLQGLNGSLNGMSNFISGSVALGTGTTINLPAGTILDPDFTQAGFDATYSCTADLRSLIPPN